jgi:hypothetical protein
MGNWGLDKADTVLIDNWLQSLPLINLRS